MTQPEDQLTFFAARSERNYLARLQLAKRLQLRSRLWSAALVALSIASATVSVAMLVEPSLYGKHGNVFWCAIGILTLAASLIITSAAYGEQAARCFVAYRQFQRISVDAYYASETVHSVRRRRRIFGELNQEYQSLLDRTPNHSQADYARAMTWKIRKSPDDKPKRASEAYITRREALKWWFIRAIDILVTALPVLILTTSIALLVPVVVWII
jgi:hypothetical protein